MLRQSHYKLGRHHKKKDLMDPNVLSPHLFHATCAPRTRRPRRSPLGATLHRLVEMNRGNSEWHPRSELISPGAIFGTKRDKEGRIKQEWNRQQLVTNPINDFVLLKSSHQQRD